MNSQLTVNSILNSFIKSIKFGSSLLFELVVGLNMGIEFVLPLLNNKAFNIKF